MKFKEHQIQAESIKWFKLVYPKFAGLLFHIPNERKQSFQAGARAKAIGTLAGVADVFLSVANNEFYGLYLEFKSGEGKQTEFQKIFEGNVVKQGYDYKIIRSFDIFKSVIENYLSNR